MTSDESQHAAATAHPPNQQRKPAWFAVPEPVRRVFNNFPLKTYPANDLPRRTPSGRQAPILFVFTSPASARRGAPSFNPACLKWQVRQAMISESVVVLITRQAYLKFNNIDFRTAPSNNHASPTGALPFILPATSSSSPQNTPVPSNKILKWTTSHGGRQAKAEDMRYEAYSSLLDHRVRSAWLFTLYLDDSNFHAVAKKLYIYPASSNILVQITLAYQLRQAAREELLKYSAYLDEDDLYAEAAKAFQALSTVLGEDENFFGSAQPGLFDASVFAYTHQLLDKNLGWQNKKMTDALKKNPNLVRHSKRILDKYFGS
jgi:metaxin